MNEEMAARVDGNYPAAERMKIEGRKREFVRIDGVERDEDERAINGRDNKDERAIGPAMKMSAQWARR